MVYVSWKTAVEGWNLGLPSSILLVKFAEKLQLQNISPSQDGRRATGILRWVTYYIHSIYIYIYMLWAVLCPARFHIWMSCPCSLQAHWSTESYTTWDRQQYSNNWDSWGSLILRQNLVKHLPSCGINLSLEGHGISKTTNCRGNNTYAGTTYGGCEGFDGIYPHENGLCPSFLAQSFFLWFFRISWSKNWGSNITSYQTSFGGIFFFGFIFSFASQVWDQSNKSMRWIHRCKGYYNLLHNEISSVIYSFVLCISCFTYLSIYIWYPLLSNQRMSPFQKISKISDAVFWSNLKVFWISQHRPITAESEGYCDGNFLGVPPQYLPYKALYSRLLRANDVFFFPPPLHKALCPELAW